MLISSMVLFIACGGTGGATDTTPPVFTSPATASVAENQTSAITLIATDTHTITYSISGGDSADFSLDDSTGVVTFDTAPDYETKTFYTFTATATDTAGNSAYKVSLLLSSMMPVQVVM